MLAGVLAVVGYIGYLNYALDSAQDDLATEKTYSAGLEAETAKLEGRIYNWQAAYKELQRLCKKCGDAVDTLEKQQATVKFNALEAIKKVKAVSLHQAALIDQLRKRQPQPAGQCAAGVQRAKDDLGALK